MKDQDEASRRDFLKIATAGAPVAAVAAIAGGNAQAEVGETAREGLRATEHTQKYYDSARF